jgi:hypothetical protein
MIATAISMNTSGMPTSSKPLIATAHFSEMGM